MPVELGANVNMYGYTFEDGFRHLMFDGGSNPHGAGTGQLLWRRSFTGGELNPWSSSPAFPDLNLGIPNSWVSFKGNGTAAQDLESMIAGSYDSDMLAFINSIPAGQKVLLTFYHEPENNTLDPARFVLAQKHMHRFVTSNKGTHDISTAIVLMGWSFDDISAPDPVDYTPVYASGDSIPAGFSIDDPAFDVFGIDFYSPGTGWYNRTWAAQTLPTGNPYGMEGYLQLMVDAINANRVSPTFTLSDLVWALGEISLTAPAADQDEWLADLVYGARDHVSTCLNICWFHNDGWPEFWMLADAQAWILTNGNSFEGTGVGISNTVTYDVEAGTTLVSKDVGFEYDVAGLATQEVAVLYGVGSQATRDATLVWSTEQTIPVIPEDARRTLSDVRRMKSRTPAARRPKPPVAGPT